MVIFLLYNVWGQFNVTPSLPTSLSSAGKEARVSKLKEYLRWMRDTVAFTPLESAVFLGMGISVGNSDLLGLLCSTGFLMGLLYGRLS